MKDQVQTAASNKNIYTAIAETHFAMCQEDSVFATLTYEDAAAAVQCEIEKQHGRLPEWKVDEIWSGVKDMHPRFHNEYPY